jgi:hypothetical protein
VGAKPHGLTASVHVVRSASADGTGLYEFDRHANARQLEALRWRVAVAERLRGSVLEHLANLDAEVVAEAFA